MRIKPKSRIRMSEIFNLGMIISIYIMLKPLYLRSSGTIQIADAFLALAALFVILKYRGRIRWPRRENTVIFSVIIFTLFVCIVNLGWTLDSSGYNYSKYSPFYIFNAMAFFLTLIIGHYTDLRLLKKAALNGALAAGLITIAAVLLGSGDGRAKGFFNNPNQLGYFGIVIVSFAFLCKGERYGFKEIATIIVGATCAIASLSKAAFIALAVQLLLCSILLEKRLTKWTIIKRLLLIGAVFTLLYLFFFTETDFLPKFEWLQRMRRRISNMSGETDTALGSGRGYDRIRELGINFLWGMGEGNFRRFTVMSGAEVHSTYASVIVSYGAIGFVLYLYILKNVMFRRKRFLRSLALSSSILLYSVSHNGVRNTLVWVFFAVLYLCNYEEKTQSASKYGRGNSEQRRVWTE